MALPLLLYYITDRSQLPGNEPERRAGLLRKIGEAARCGVNFIQLREKDLAASYLEGMASEAARLVLENAPGDGSGFRTRLLINSRTDVALASVADGVHLPGNDVSPRAVREIYARSATKSSTDPVISVACHEPGEVERALREGADLALFAPVFGKHAPGGEGRVRQPAGLAMLREACQCGMPVLALGGVTLQNARQCSEAGAAGIAAVRLFQEGEMEDVVRRLRQI